MGKKNRGSSGSRAPIERERPSGGLRNAGVVRQVSRNISQARSGYDRRADELLEDWDMSAFEVGSFNPEGVARYEPARAAQSLPPQVQRNAVEPARAKTATPKLLALPARKITMVPAKQVKTANRDHLQALPSPQARKENVRSNCKKRPEPGKRGSGTSRSFVPWCK